MSEKIFVAGMRFSLPSEKAPEYVKGSMSIKVSEFIEFAEKNKTKEDWLNINLKIGKSGKGYAELNTWKPTKKEEKVVNEDEIDTDLIPF